MACVDESAALEMEKGLIKVFRTCGFDLANYTDGGDGVSGLRHSEETRKAMSAKRLGKRNTEQQNKLISARLLGVKKAPFSIEHRQKLGALAKGKRWYNNGESIRAVNTFHTLTIWRNIWLCTANITIKC